jgi:hypothetical protein
MGIVKINKKIQDLVSQNFTVTSFEGYYFLFNPKTKFLIQLNDSAATLLNTALSQEVENSAEVMSFLDSLKEYI